MASSISSHSPCFFKIILQETIQNGKLGIPRKFVKNHGKGISSPAMLRVSSDAVWEVELTKCDGKIWLEKGWQQFSNHYSLDLGHLLVFRYDGNSIFNVVIFDRSATEIQYPHTNNDHRQSDEILEQNIERSEDNESIQVPRRKKRKKSQSPRPRPHKMMRTTNPDSRTECKGKSGLLAQTVNHNERVKALERVINTFKSDKPFFLVLMQPSYVGHGKRYCLAIPRNFVEKHLMKEPCSVILYSSSGKTYIAAFKQKQRGKKLNAYLQTGWGTFVRDNNIQVGDVCAFELTNSIEITFKVVIYQGQHANCHQSMASEIHYPCSRDNQRRSCEILERNIEESEDNDPVNILENNSPSRNSAIQTETECHGNSEFLAQHVERNESPDRNGDKSMSHNTIPRHEKAKALERASSSFKSENPYFLIFMQPNYVGLSHGKRFRLGIPLNFVKKHLMKNHCSVTLYCSSDKTWIAKFKQIYRGKKLYSSYLQNGWGTFVQDNNIQVGDVCAFELTNSIEITFKVVIYQGQHANCHQSMASEIQYPYTANNRKPSDEILERDSEESEDYDTVNILENISPSRNSAIQTEPDCNEHSEYLAQQVEHNESGARNGDKISHNRIPQHEKLKALERASHSFKSENPFFLVFMQPDCVGLSHSKRYRLAIPRNFVEKYLMKEHCSVILCSSSENTWIVKLKQIYIGKRLHFYLQTGWATFVHDNNIQVGDVCAFELANSIEISFKVVIYKGQHANCHQSLISTDEFHPVKRKPPYASRHCTEPLSALDKAKAFQMASAFKSENPFFVIVLQQSYLNYYSLNIPSNFARQYIISTNKQVIFLLSNGKAWPVIYPQQSYEKPYVMLGKGWRKFAEDNNLEVGDACVFELIKGAQTTMNVIIYKRQPVEDANSGTSLEDTSKEKQSEVHESLMIETEESGRMKEKGDMSNLHCDYSFDASGENLDDILISKTSCAGETFEKASQSYQSLQQSEAIQDTNRLELATNAIDSSN